MARSKNNRFASPDSGRNAAARWQDVQCAMLAGRGQAAYRFLKPQKHRLLFYFVGLINLQWQLLRLSLSLRVCVCCVQTLWRLSNVAIFWNFSDALNDYCHGMAFGQLRCVCLYALQQKKKKKRRNTCHVVILKRENWLFYFPQMVAFAELLYGISHWSLQRFIVHLANY